MKKNLNKLRSDIDKIDRDILDLLSKRAAIAKDIGTLKNDGVIYKPEREDLPSCMMFKNSSTPDS